MMHPFELTNLLGPVFSIFIIAFLITFLETASALIAIIAASLKSSFYFIYFGFLFDGTFTYLDDWSYLNGGSTLHHLGISFLNVAEHKEIAMMLAGGEHFLYYLVNAFAIGLFGFGYYAPVALLVIVSCLIALFGGRLASKEFRWNEERKTGFFLFLMFYPDILVWSNIVNGKDLLVLLCHLGLLSGVSAYFQSQKKRALLLFSLSTFVVLFLRFYVPLLFGVAFGLSLFLGMNRRQRGKLTLGLCALAALFLITDLSAIEYAIGALQKDFVNPLYGFLRFNLTPIPFFADESYAFLNLPSLIHWLLIPFAWFGIGAVYRQRTFFSRFFLFYFFTFVALYSSYGELQGPRHRIQLDFAWAVFHYMGFLVIADRVKRALQLGFEQKFSSGLPLLP